MTPGARFKDWIEGLAESWKDRLAGWIVSSAAAAASRGLKAASPEAGHYSALLDTLERRTGTSTDLRDTVAWLKSMEDTPVGWVIGILIFVIQTVGIALGGSEAVGNEIKYAQNRILRTNLVDPLVALTAWRRQDGVDPAGIDELKAAGWSDDQIRKYEFATRYYPGASDLVRFQAREVFEPEMIQRYGLDDEFGNIELAPFRRAGMDDEITLYYWRAHWEHASWNQVVEMLHRGYLSEDEVRDWFRLVEIPPFWRDKLIATAYNVPTRVDVRRFYDLKTIDEARLREIYAAMGYHGKDLDDYVLWTKIYVELPDLIARWKNGWITLDDARERLVALGMTVEAAEELIQTKVSVDEPDDVVESKALTKTEIYKGVKQGKITPEEGVELIMELGYTRDKAEYLLDINVEALTGSPENLDDFRRLTNKYRSTVTMSNRTEPEDIRTAAAELVKIKAEVDALAKTEKAERARLTDEEIIPAGADAKLKEIQVALNRARAELERQQIAYDGLVAAWKRTAG